MGCGGSTNDSSSNIDCVKPSKVNIHVGSGVVKNDTGTCVIFVFGGPGSKKGCIMEYLANVFGFIIINAEDLIMQTAFDQTKPNQDHFLTIRKFIKDHPNITTLDSILSAIRYQIDANPRGIYLVNIMPNIRANVQIENFRHDCDSSMTKFEYSYRVSFALNLAIPCDGVVKQVQADNAKQNLFTPLPGEQTDEADSSRTQKRAAFYQTTVQCFLDYFKKTERIVSVDVSSGKLRLIWDRVRQFFAELNFTSLHNTNIVLLFVFTTTDVASLIPYGIYTLVLRDLVSQPYASTTVLLRSLCKLIDSTCSTTLPILVDVTKTRLQSPKPSPHSLPKKDIKFSDFEHGVLRKYIPTLPTNNKYPEFKALVSTDNDAFLFPVVTNNQTCIDLALGVATLRAAPEIS